MSYVVLARKYRPRSFQEMVGQDAVVRALSSALSTGRLHHAYLFTGTRGIGKTTVSRILAKSLNCTGADGTGGITATPCGRCTACTEIDGDRFVDYIELDAASNRSIDEVRDLLERAAYKPAVGRFKVFMIDEAHQLTKDAFNALLKTLEEPPDYLKFVLATTDPQKMLPTVLSRCLQFNLRPMPPAIVQQHLEDVLGREAIAFEPEAVVLLSQAARGSMRDALSLTDQAIAYGQGQLTAEGVRAMIGLAGPTQVADLLAALARHDAGAIHAAALALRTAGHSASGAVEGMTQALQQVALEQALPGSVERSVEAPWLEWATQWEPQEVQLLYAMLTAARTELGLAPDEHAALLMLCWRFLAFVKPSSAAAAPPTPARALVIDSARAARAAAVVSAPAPLPATPVVTQGPVAQPAVAEHPGAMQAWVDRMADVTSRGAVGGLVRELALQAQCIRFDPASASVVLRVARESLTGASLADKLGEALSGADSRPLRVSVELGEVHDSLAIREARARKARQDAAEALIRDDPLVVDLLQQFPGARLVPGSVRPV